MSFPYVKSKYNPTLNADEVSDEIALHNGEALYEYMIPFISGDWEALMTKYGKYIEPLPKFNEDKIIKIKNYFNNDTAKKWLGKQYYLFAGFGKFDHQRITPDFAAYVDDVPTFFNWLFLNDKTIAQNNSPLNSTLRGGKRKVRKTRKLRRSYRSRR